MAGGGRLVADSARQADASTVIHSNVATEDSIPRMVACQCLTGIRISKAPWLSGSECMAAEWEANEKEGNECPPTQMPNARPLSYIVSATLGCTYVCNSYVHTQAIQPKLSVQSAPRLPRQANKQENDLFMTIRAFRWASLGAATCDYPPGWVRSTPCLHVPDYTRDVLSTTPSPPSPPSPTPTKNPLGGALRFHARPREATLLE